MAKAELRIELPTSTFRAGEPVRGEIVVKADASCTCKAVTIARRWRAHGRGNTHSSSWTTTVVTRDLNWSSGMEYRYPFELATDPAPISFHGTYLNVDWELQASADLPWALDPSATQPVLITRGEGPASWNVAAPPPGSKGDSGIGSAIVLGLFGSIFGGVGVLTATMGSHPSPMGWLFAVVGGLVVSFGVTGPIRRKMAEHAIGKPEVRVDPSTARGGAVIVTTFRSRPPGPVTVTAASVQIIARERVVSGGGKNSTTHTQDHAIGSLQLDPGQISTSPTIDLEMPVTLPADAPASFSAPDNHLNWFVRVRLDIQGEPSWQEEFPLLVQ